MLRFESSIAIDGTPERVWATLIQTDRWPSFGAGIERVDGRLGPGERLTLHVADSSRPFKLKVTEWQPTGRIVLAGGMPLGLFTGTRTYRLDPDGDKTRFQMIEVFSGPLAPLITRSIPDLQPSFDAFAAGLRAAVDVDAETPGETP